MVLFALTGFCESNLPEAVLLRLLETVVVVSVGIKLPLAEDNRARVPDP